jgi:DNA-binding CsgD family transcriptional regulator
MAGLMGSLLNFPPPLLRALDTLDKQPKNCGDCPRYDTTKDIIAQTGVPDPALVRLSVKENHMLSPKEIERLVETYKAGEMSQQELARQFRISVETANRHLRRRKQALKLGAATVCRTTPSPHP